MNVSITRLRALALAQLLLLPGCGNDVFKHVPGTTYGDIMIGDARVSSRERLVNDRLWQDNWLRDQLTRSDQQEFGFQGAADLRSFMGATARVEATTNQIEINQYRAQAAQSADAARRAQEQAELDNQLQRQYKQRQMEAIAQQPASAFAYTPPTSAPGTPAQPPQPPQAPSGPQVGEEVRKLKEDAGKFTIDPSSLKLPDKLKPSPQEQLRDKLEYRSLIRSEILENALDDRHDLRGNTMLRFDLDAAVRPDNDTSAWAVVTIEVDTSKWYSTCVSEQLYEDWRRHVERDLNERAVLLIRNGGEAGRIGEAEEELGRDPKLNQIKKDRGFVAGMMAYLPEYISLEMQREWIAAPPHQYKPYWEIVYAKARKELGMAPASDKKDGELESPPARSQLVHQIYKEINRAHEGLINKLFPKYLVASTKGGMLSLRKNNTNQEFCARLHDSADVYAYAATPKESVQRVAEVASRRNVSEFMLALSFLAGNSASGKLYTDYMKANEGIFQAINRQPLVVGFNKGSEVLPKTPSPAVATLHGILGSFGMVEKPRVKKAEEPEIEPCDLDVVRERPERCTSFGWIMGPRFAIKNDGSSSHYRHTVEFNPLSSFISLPGWLSNVDFKVKTHWVNDDGTVPDKPKFSKVMPVRLKRDLATVTDVLAIDSIREPRPFSRQLLKFDEGAAATVVIPGQNLWRNPSVILGTQQADEITVLPDMRGLIAKFREVRLQRPKGSDEWDVLQVWTSEGSAEAALVKIIPAKRPAPQKAAGADASKKPGVSKKADDKKGDKTADAKKAEEDKAAKKKTDDKAAGSDEKKE